MATHPSFGLLCMQAVYVARKSAQDLNLPFTLKQAAAIIDQLDEGRAISEIQQRPFNKKSTSKPEGVWQINQRIEAVRDRMRDLDEHHLGQTYKGLGEGRTTAYDWTPEGKEEYTKLKKTLAELRQRLTSIPDDQ